MSYLAGVMTLPEELTDRPQWALSGASKAPLSVDSQGRLYNAAPNRPGEWMDFDDAWEWAFHFRELVTTHTDSKGITTVQTGLKLGYMINESDEFTCIDLDVKDQQTHPNNPELWTTQETFDRYWAIVQTFDTYTERSQSGKGLHAWMKGSIGKGYRRDGVEVYSQDRFMICTGDAVVLKPIENRQSLLANMITQMRPVNDNAAPLIEVEQDEDDWSILLRASRASNSEKFMQLWIGDWAGMGFPSQSEADLALFSMLCFYSECNSQCVRLFRESGLGKRDKAMQDDVYTNRTLGMVRDRQHREYMADLAAQAAGARLMAELQAEALVIEHIPAPPPPTIEPPPPIAGNVVTLQLSPPPAAPVPQHNGIAWPPGIAGRVARYVYDSAVRPVKEVAIVAALGMLAGICGKAWTIPQSGLNLYIILVARSAIGKESMHLGISSLMKAAMQHNVKVGNYIDFNEYVSGPALVKACAVTPCFVNVNGEWGRKLQRLAGDDRDGPLQTLRTQMTNLYQKSGPSSIAGGMSYSAKDNNVSSVDGVSYSMIGETTPGTFYKALTDSMMEDGFLSRFLIIDYDGARPDENEYRIDKPDEELAQYIAYLAGQAEVITGSLDGHHQVGRTDDAGELMKQFNKRCDTEINATDDESRRQMWNRAALKSMRIAALLAVADNYMNPVITVEHVAWAQDVVKRDVAMMRKRLDNGDVGENDASRERKIVTVMKDYLTKPVPKGYKFPDSMRENQIIPRAFMQIRVQRVQAFTTHRMGVSKALDDTISTLMSNGYIMEVKRDKVAELYNFHGQAYRILKLPDYDEESRI